jgi:3-mercaptopyruvate sulfurtransferase SseA
MVNGGTKMDKRFAVISVSQEDGEYVDDLECVLFPCTEEEGENFISQQHEKNAKMIEARENKVKEVLDEIHIPESTNCQEWEDLKTKFPTLKSKTISIDDTVSIDYARNAIRSAIFCSWDGVLLLWEFPYPNLNDLRVVEIIRE